MEEEGEEEEAESVKGGREKRLMRKLRNTSHVTPLGPVFFFLLPLRLLMNSSSGFVNLIS